MYYIWLWVNKSNLLWCKKNSSFVDILLFFCWYFVVLNSKKIIFHSKKSFFRSKTCFFYPIVDIPVCYIIFDIYAILYVLSALKYWKTILNFTKKSSLMWDRNSWLLTYQMHDRLTFSERLFVHALHDNRLLVVRPFAYSMFYHV